MNGRFVFSPPAAHHSRPCSLRQEFLDGLLAVAYPTDCPLCGSELASDGWLRICRSCWADLQPWCGPVCARCGLPFASPQALDSALAECGACRRDEPAFDGAGAFGLYTGKLRRVVLRLKFSGDTRLGRRLGQLLASAWAALPRGADFNSPVIIPVPLHPSRRRERGFNQSDLLAEGLVRALRKHQGATVPAVAKSWLLRQRATPPQTGLSVAARRENLRGAFAVVKPAEVRGRTIVLVDDVMTTGATISACARALKHAGAARVLGLTLARATPQFPDLAPPETDNAVDGRDRDST